MKSCTQCNVSKPLSDFSVGYRRKDGSVNHRSWCKLCVNKFSHKNYMKNSPQVKKRYTGDFDMGHYGKQRYIEFREWIDKLRSEPCTDCKKKYPAVCMDWDHVRGTKVKAICQMWSMTREKVVEELAKCELVCANCHRIRTYTRRHAERLKETA